MDKRFAMLLLAVDTAGPDCAVALARDGPGGVHMLAQESERIVRGHAERLTPMIEELLSSVGVTFAGIARIAVTTGPGSFTGIRVGVAAARGLALALGIPAVGVASMEALLFPLVREFSEGTGVAVLGGKRREVFALAGELASGRVLAGPISIDANALAGLACGFPRPLFLTGSGAPLLASEPRLEAAHMVDSSVGTDMAAVAALGFRAEAAGPPVPLYIRAADAKPPAGKAIERQ